MQEEELIWLIALTQVTQVGPVHARQLLNNMGSAKAVFQASRDTLEKVPGIGSVRAGHIYRQANLSMAEKEMRFIEKHRIKALTLADPDYPQRLLHTYDAPVLLYYRGNASLNATKVISVIGTRTPTEYGKDRVRDLLSALAPLSPLIVSGLAYGIDTLAHHHALDARLETIGILAHGLDRIYPQANKRLAKMMLEQGGLLTDFPSGTNPDAVNFPRRNRIVAGLADAVVVIETGEKGGSMITARMACGYDRELFAVPGRVTDAKSAGCLAMIREQRAHLLHSPEDIAQVMNWAGQTGKTISAQASMPLNLSPAESTILELVRTQGSLRTEDIRQLTQLPHGETANALLSLEMQQVLAALPGGRYRLIE